MSLLGGSSSKAVEQTTTGTDEALVLGANARLSTTANSGLQLSNVSGGVVIGDGGAALEELGQRFSEALQVVSGSFAQTAQNSAASISQQSEIVTQALAKISELGQTKVSDGASTALQGSAKFFLIGGLIVLLALIFRPAKP